MTLRGLPRPGHAICGILASTCASPEKGRRQLCRACLDWTERRPHIGGAIGAALAERWLALGWITRAKDSRAVSVTPVGERGFRDSLGMVPVEDEKAVA